MADVSKYGYQPNQVEEAKDFTPVPEGWYNAICTSQEAKENKAKNGAYIKAVFKIVDGTHTNRLVYKNFNLGTTKNDEKAQMAVRIGRGQMKSCFRACGDVNAVETAFWMNIVVQIKVTTRKNKGTDPQYAGKMENDIQNFKKVGEATDGRTRTPQQEPLSGPQQALAAEPNVGVPPIPHQGTPAPQYTEYQPPPGDTSPY